MGARALACLACLLLAAVALASDAQELPSVRLRTRTLRTRQVRLPGAVLGVLAACCWLKNHTEAAGARQTHVTASLGQAATPPPLAQRTGGHLPPQLPACAAPW